jgi:hypothetical protein
VLKLDSRPISRVDIGFEGGRVYVYALFRESAVVDVKTRETCSVQKVGVRAGFDWSRVEEQEQS